MSDDDKFCDNNKHIWQNKKCWAHFDEFVRKGLSEKVVFELKLKWQENIKEFPCKYFRLKKKNGGKKEDTENIGVPNTQNSL